MLKYLRWCAEATFFAGLLCLLVHNAWPDGCVSAYGRMFCDCSIRKAEMELARKMIEVCFMNPSIPIGIIPRSLLVSQVPVKRRSMRSIVETYIHICSSI